MTEQSSSKPSVWRKYRNQIFLGFIVILAIYIVLLLLLDNQGQLTNAEGVLQHLRDFPIGYLIPVIICQLLVILFRFIEWHYYIGVIGAKGKISAFDSAVIHISGFTMVVSPGKAAELLKAVFLKSKTGIPIARGMPVVIAERIVDGIAVILIMAVTMVLAGDSLTLGDYYDISRLIIFSASALIVAGLIVIQIQPLAMFFLNLIKKLPLIGRLYSPLVTFYESSREIFKLRHVIPMSLVGVGVYVSSSVGFVIILMGLGFDFSWQLFLQTTFILGVTSAVAALSFVPNGAGVAEASNTVMLTGIIGSVNPLMTLAVATTAAIMQGFFHKWFRVLVGLLVAIVFRNRLFDESIEQELLAYEQEKHTEASS
jgi:glycosyltransferase 2 family protein